MFNITPDARPLNIFRFQKNFDWNIFTLVRTDSSPEDATFRGGKLFFAPSCCVVHRNDALNIRYRELEELRLLDLDSYLSFLPGRIVRL